MSDEKIHTEQSGGIFIPYDKLLQQQSDKLDKILDELREFDRRKLDIGVFDSFRNSYEQRHEVLKSSVENIDRSLIGRAEIVQDYKDFKEEASERLDQMEKYRAETEAVKAQTRYYLAGGGAVGLLVIINLLINFWQLSNGRF